MPLHAEIEANAAKLRDLNADINLTVKKRHLGEAEREAWSEACRRFHISYDQLAFPGGLSDAMRRLTQGEPAVIESAVVFLETDPWFFRSGYIKERILEQLRRVPLDNDKKDRLRQLILARVRDSKTRREFRRYCRLAPFVTDPFFEEQIAQLAGPSGVKPKHARWVLEHLRQASRKSL
jgi:hypothetical protein